jgi:integrase
VPSKLRAVLGCSEIVRSLQTSDLRRAERLASALDERISRLFKVAASVAAGGGMSGDSSTDVLRGQELIERLCDTYLRQLLAEDRASRQSGEESGDVEGGLLYVADDYQDDVEHERVEIVAPAAEALLAEAGVELPPEPLKRLLRELLHTRVVSIGAALKDRGQDAAFVPRTLSLQGPPSGAIAPNPDPAPDPHTIGELATLFVQHQRDSGTWKAGATAKQRAARLQRLVVWFGANTPLSEIDPLRCQGVFELFQQRNLKSTTQNTELKTLNSLFNYGVKVEWMARNPAKGLRAKEPPPREQKLPFDSDDLRKIFSPALFEATKGRSPIGRKKGEGVVQMFMGERYWGPLLCLYAGLRPGEAVLLRLDGFDHVDGVQCLAVEPEEDDELKTASSKRRIPVHSHLVELGLMEHVEALRAAGERLLFPRMAKLKTPEKTLTAWFPSFRKAVGVTNKRKTLHSLRHTFNQRLADAGVQDSTIGDLMGHRNPTMTRGRYGSGTSVVVLRDAVERLDFRGELAALKKPTKP